jgi:hypothetical protein
MDNNRYLDERFTTASHICCLYYTEAEHQIALSGFIYDGLVQREKIIYIVDPHENSHLLDSLDFEDLDIAPAIAYSQVTFFTTEQTYLSSGTFNPVHMITWLMKETETALNENYAGLRVTSDMGWTHRHAITPKQIRSYEAAVNDIFTHSSCRGLCRYDRWNFSPTLLIDILAMHPYILYKEQIHTNPLQPTFTDVLHSIDKAFH